MLLGGALIATFVALCCWTIAQGAPQQSNLVRLLSIFSQIFTKQHFIHFHKHSSLSFVGAGVATISRMDGGCDLGYLDPDFRAK